MSKIAPSHHEGPTRAAPWLLLAFVAATPWPKSAAAEDKAVCLDAADQGQKLRSAHKLLEARDKFRVCAVGGCPAVVQGDCAQWLDAVEKALPSVVLAAKNGSGSDLLDVNVTMDGQPLATKLDGQAIAVDPGPHAFSFTGADGTKAEQQVIVKEGAQSQPVAVVLVQAAPTPAAVQPASAPGGGLGTQKLLALVAGGVGVIGVGVGSAFGLVAMSKKSDAQKVCPGTCADDAGVNAWNDALSAGNVSTALFIVGGVGLAGAAALWFTAPSSSGASGAQVGFGLGGVQVRGAW